MDDERGAYELWDTETANAVGAYESLGASLRDVAATVRRYGPDSPAVTTLALIRVDGPEDAEHTLAGRELLERALAWRAAKEDLLTASAHDV